MDSCLTYFCVIYDKNNFNLEDFKKMLGLTDNDFSISLKKQKIEIGRNDYLNIDINIMIRETLKKIFGKENILVELKEKYGLEYYLVRVVYIKSEEGEIHPILSLDNDIIEFIYKTKAKEDLDYYII